MNPNEPNLPPTTPTETTVPVVSGIDDNKNPINENDLFIIKSAEKKPLDKKSVAFVATITIIGVILLIAVLVFALIGSASGLANDYRRLAYNQINKTSQPLEVLEPGAVLNKRDLETPGKTIDLSQESQPHLESVLFVGGWSERYMQTVALEKNMHLHYQHIGAYENDLKKLIDFDNALENIFGEEPDLTATVVPSDAFSIRSASGSYDAFAKTIEKQPIPEQLKDIKKQLSTIYHNKATIYVTWAQLVEAGTMTGETKAKADLLEQTTKAASLVEDQSFIAAFKPSYTELVKEHILLRNQLAN